MAKKITASLRLFPGLELVGAEGFEPSAFCSRSKRATRLRYAPTLKKEPAASYSRTGESRTTLGDGALDFRVRNGNGYVSPSVATGEKPKLEAKENHNPHARAREIPHLVKCEQFIEK